MREINFNLAIEKALELQRRKNVPFNEEWTTFSCDYDIKERILKWFFKNNKNVKGVWINEENNNDEYARIDLKFTRTYFNNLPDENIATEVKQRRYPLYENGRYFWEVHSKYCGEMLEVDKMQILVDNSKKEKTYLFTTYADGYFLLWDASKFNLDELETHTFNCPDYTVNSTKYISKLQYVLPYDSDAIVYRGKIEELLAV